MLRQIFDLVEHVLNLNEDRHWCIHACVPLSILINLFISTVAQTHQQSPHYQCRRRSCCCPPPLPIINTHGVVLWRYGADSHHDPIFLTPQSCCPTLFLHLLFLILVIKVVVIIITIIVIFVVIIDTKTSSSSSLLSSAATSSSSSLTLLLITSSS